MTTDEVEAALLAAFERCDAASCPLTDKQKQILSTSVKLSAQVPTPVSDSANPLDELASEELQAFLQFVLAQEQQNSPWKMQLLNDWLNGNDSGTVQFIRDRYGIAWLNRLETYHFVKYCEAEEMKVRVGDRIEISNGLWEWVQESGPCSREWFLATVIQVDVNADDTTNCIIRFANGSEYEIQGMYQWNRYNWRWAVQ